MRQVDCVASFFFALLTVAYRFPGATFLSEAGPGRFGRQLSFTDIYHTIPPNTCSCNTRSSAAAIPGGYIQLPATIGCVPLAHVPVMHLHRPLPYPHAPFNAWTRRTQVCPAGWVLFRLFPSVSRYKNRPLARVPCSRPRLGTIRAKHGCYRLSLVCGLSPSRIYYYNVLQRRGNVPNWALGKVHYEPKMYETLFSLLYRC